MITNLYNLRHFFEIYFHKITNKNVNPFRNGGTKKEDGQTNGGKEPKRKNSPYSDVPNDMFYCHLCAKHMWDSTSFENHLKGRTHQVRKLDIINIKIIRINSHLNVILR